MAEKESDSKKSSLSRKERSGRRKSRSKSRKRKEKKEKKGGTSCCGGKKRDMKRSKSRKGKGKRKHSKRRSKSRVGKSGKGRTRKGKRSRKSRKSRKSSRGKSKTDSGVIMANREHLGRSQSLTKVEDKPEKGSGLTDEGNQTPTPYSPMRQDKRTRRSEDGTALKMVRQQMDNNTTKRKYGKEKGKRRKRGRSRFSCRRKRRKMTSHDSKTGKRKKKIKSAKKMRRKKKLKEESSTDSQTKIIAPHLHLGKSESFINAEGNKSSEPQNDNIGQMKSSRSSKKQKRRMKKAKAKKRKSKKARKSSLTCCRKKREMKRVKKRKKEREDQTAASSQNSEKNTTGRTSTDSKSSSRGMRRKCLESTPSQVIRHKYSAKSHKIETLDENKETGSSSEREDLPSTTSGRSERVRGKKRKRTGEKPSKTCCRKKRKLKRAEANQRKRKGSRRDANSTSSRSRAEPRIESGKANTEIGTKESYDSLLPHMHLLNSNSVQNNTQQPDINAMSFVRSQKLKKGMRIPSEIEKEEQNREPPLARSHEKRGRRQSKQGGHKSITKGTKNSISDRSSERNAKPKSLTVTKTGGNTYEESKKLNTKDKNSESSSQRIIESKCQTLADRTGKQLDHSDKFLLIHPETERSGCLVERSESRKRSHTSRRNVEKGTYKTDSDPKAREPTPSYLPKASNADFLMPQMNLGKSDSKESTTQTPSSSSRKQKAKKRKTKSKKDKKKSGKKGKSSIACCRKKIEMKKNGKTSAKSKRSRKSGKSKPVPEARELEDASTTTTKDSTKPYSETKTREPPTSDSTKAASTDDSLMPQMNFGKPDSTRRRAQTITSPSSKKQKSKKRKMKSKKDKKKSGKIGKSVIACCRKKREMKKKGKTSAKGKRSRKNGKKRKIRKSKPVPEARELEDPSTKTTKDSSKPYTETKTREPPTSDSTKTANTGDSLMPQMNFGKPYSTGHRAQTTTSPSSKKQKSKKDKKKSGKKGKSSIACCRKKREMKKKGKTSAKSKRSRKSGKSKPVPEARELEDASTKTTKDSTKPYSETKTREPPTSDSTKEANTDDSLMPQMNFGKPDSTRLRAQTITSPSSKKQKSRKRKRKSRKDKKKSGKKGKSSIACCRKKREMKRKKKRRARNQKNRKEGKKSESRKSKSVFATKGKPLDNSEEPIARGGTVARDGKNTARKPQTETYTKVKPIDDSDKLPPPLPHPERSGDLVAPKKIHTKSYGPCSCGRSKTSVKDASKSDTSMNTREHSFSDSTLIISANCLLPQMNFGEPERFVRGGDEASFGRPIWANNITEKETSPPTKEQKAEGEKLPKERKGKRTAKKRRPSMACCQKRREMKKESIRKTKSKNSRKASRKQKKSKLKTCRGAAEDGEVREQAKRDRDCKSTMNASFEKIKTSKEDHDKKPSEKQDSIQRGSASSPKRKLELEKEASNRAEPRKQMRNKKKGIALACCHRKRATKRAKLRQGKTANALKKGNGFRKGKKKSRKSLSSTSTKSKTILENREHLARSQSLIAFEDKQAREPHFEHSKNRTFSESAPKQPEFQPHRQRDDSTSKKKEGEAPSTAIDIDSSMRARRTQKPRQPPEEQQGKGSEKKESYYTGELVKDYDDRYRQTKPKLEEPALEPSIVREPDLIPMDNAIDPEYPAQRIIISNFIRNGNYIKRWLYEDIYSVSGPRPTIGDLLCSGPRKQRLKRCCCCHRNICEQCEEEYAARKHCMEHLENERIRGELQRLDVILKNLDD